MSATHVLRDSRVSAKESMVEVLHTGPLGLRHADIHLEVSASTSSEQVHPGRGSGRIVPRLRDAAASTGSMCRVLKWETVLFSPLLFKSH